MRAVTSLRTAVLLTAVSAACLTGRVAAQAPAGATPAAAPSSGPLYSLADLEILVGPIALYPDDLVGIVLPSSTTPLDVVKAQRFLEKRKNNATLEPPTLPEPVRNLLNYPDIVKQMSDDLEWTERLGAAVVNQQGDVMASIQAFRRKTQSAGNLKTDDKQIVVHEKEIIKIVPANPQVIYVPQYQPTTVIVQQPTPAVAYYPTPCPVYYYPYPPGATFATGFFAGAATAWAVGWAHNEIHHEHWEHHYEEIEHYQQNREDYARESREDWQKYGNEARTDRQQGTAERQTQRQDASGQAQTQRQGAASEAQGQRGEMQTQRQAAAGEAQTQRGQTQAQRQEAVGQGQGQRPPTKPSSTPSSAQRQAAAGGQGGQAWRPQQPSNSAQPSAAGRSGGSQYARAGDPNGYGARGASSAQSGAFGGVTSGLRVPRSSTWIPEPIDEHRLHAHGERRFRQR